MSQGTLYVMDQSPRSFVLEDIVKHYKLDVKITTEKDAAYNAKFPLGKTPAFIGSKGYALTETIAIASYFFSLVPKEKLGGLLGKNGQQYAAIIKYVSLFNQEWIDAVVPGFKMAIGKFPFNKRSMMKIWLNWISWVRSWKLDCLISLIWLVKD